MYQGFSCDSVSCDVVCTQKKRPNETILNYNLNLMSLEKIQFYALNCVYLDSDVYSIQV